jgi:hypothetical protein
MPSLLSHVPAVAAANAAANADEDNDDAAANDQMGGRSTWHFVEQHRGPRRAALGKVQGTEIHALRPQRESTRKGQSVI